MVMLLAIRWGMTPLQNDRGAGLQPVQPKSYILLACMNSIAVHGAVVIIPPMTPTVIFVGAEEARIVETRLARVRVIFLKFAMTMDVR
jgi:hypothetical protein